MTLKLDGSNGAAFFLGHAVPLHNSLPIAPGGSAFNTASAAQESLRCFQTVGASSTAGISLLLDVAHRHPALTLFGWVTRSSSFSAAAGRHRLAAHWCQRLYFVQGAVLDGKFFPAQGIQRFVILPAGAYDSGTVDAIPFQTRRSPVKIAAHAASRYIAAFSDIPCHRYS